MHQYHTRLKLQKPAGKPEHVPQNNSENNENPPSPNKQAEIEYSPAKTVNIRNIVEDFKKTLLAIGAPKDINEETQTYLKLVNIQAAKENPSPKIIRSNLKNAAGIVDEYIAQTLQKPSKVVTDWIDALLLQKIDYKTDKMPEEEQQLLPEEIPPVIQENHRLVPVYQEAEKLTDLGEYEKALDAYNQLLPEVQKAGDRGLETKIYLDRGYIYDVNGELPPALENYNRAAQLAFMTGDHKTRALAHYNMASIYDESGKTELALSHYYEALSLDGHTENIKAQTHTLNDVGNIFSSKKQYKSALDHYSVGIWLTKETDDIKGRAYMLSNSASVFKNTGMDAKALKYYKKSIQYDIKSGNLEGYSVNYEYCADIMARNNHNQKAKKLYKKSLEAAQKLGDRSLTARINEKLQLF